jgi:hypothetical protein
MRPADLGDEDSGRGAMEEMSEGPSIKGVLLTKLVDDVRELLERNENDRDRLSAPL